MSYQRIILAIILTGLSISADEKSNSVKLGKFLPYKTETDSQLEDKVLRILKDKLNKYSVEEKKGSREENLSSSKDLSDYYIEGYYKRSANKKFLTVYAQVYDTKSGTVIDAVTVTNDLSESLGEGFENYEDKTNTNDEKVLEELSGKILTSIKSNPDKVQINENINENLLGKSIGKELTFPISKQKKEEVAKAALSGLGMEEIVTASRSKETRLDAPASIIVITEEEIRDRGYTSIDEILYDLPGFDISFSNGIPHIIGFQRGYRTPSMSRTLFMIDGKINNELYSQTAELTRQIPFSNIKRIEVLYGPASVVYGANAFQGIINIITKDGKENTKPRQGNLSIQTGSNDTKAVDGGFTMKSGDWSFAGSGRYFQSNEADLSKREGFFKDQYYNDSKTWGPMRYEENNNVRLWRYHDPSFNKGALFSASYKDLKIGTINWERNEGYGVQYPGDKVQNNALWKAYNHQVYGEIDSKITDRLNLYSLLTYRRSGQGGNYIESFSDSGTNYISNTRWNTFNYSWLFNQNAEYKFTEKFKLAAGLKFEQRQITRNYDIPGYFNAYDSNLNYEGKQIDVSSIYPNGYGVGKSTDPVYLVPPQPKDRMPRNNIAGVNDIGGFLLGTFDFGRFRFSPGVRYDENSIYGSSVNPRISSIYRITQTHVIKLIYGEAFQEPPFILLYGGFSGRRANPNLKPEKARTWELIFMRQGDSMLNEVSVYYSRYNNVIKEEGENAGERKIYGLELKNQFYFSNFIPNSPRLNVFAYYTYTEAQSSIYYSFNTKNPDWLEGKNALGKYETSYNNAFPNSIPLPREEQYYTLGDIAPHKFNLGLNLPIWNRFNWNLRGDYVSKRQLYLRNTLRNQGVTTDPYVLLNTAFTIKFSFGNLVLKVNNLMNHSYTHPGVEAANSGNNYYEGSQGFNSSLLPQPGRSFLLSFNMSF
ncbi:MAG: TonB-dependent receptor [Leptospiraceae bacterium]|nr:TonB-dependent receptor [Leptospiraceae bacterium]